MSTAPHARSPRIRHLRAPTQQISTIFYHLALSLEIAPPPLSSLFHLSTCNIISPRSNSNNYTQVCAPRSAARTRTHATHATAARIADATASPREPPPLRTNSPTRSYTELREVSEATNSCSMPYEHPTTTRNPLPVPITMRVVAQHPTFNYKAARYTCLPCHPSSPTPTAYGPHTMMARSHNFPSPPVTRPHL